MTTEFEINYENITEKYAKQHKYLVPVELTLTAKDYITSIKDVDLIRVASQKVLFDIDEWESESLMLINDKICKVVDVEILDDDVDYLFKDNKFYYKKIEILLLLPVNGATDEVEAEYIANLIMLNAKLPYIKLIDLVTQETVKIELEERFDFDVEEWHDLTCIEDIDYAYALIN